MGGYRKYEDHKALAQSMADRMGVDVEDLMQAGRLPPEALDDLISRCMCCVDPEVCKAWLTGTPGAPAPEACRNRDAFAALREG